jgi:histone acetyltransferase (RNA polymerase elongator complex component)
MLNTRFIGLTHMNSTVARNNIHGIRLAADPPASANVYSASKIQHQRSSIQQAASRSRPFIIPIFIPHAGCPHQCVFCNQRALTGAKTKNPSPAAIHMQIVDFLRYKRKHRSFTEIAYFGGNFLGLNTDDIEVLLYEAGRFVQTGKVDGIRFSTRPDTMDLTRLDLIKPYPVSTIELGVQSMDDHVLSMARRGHSAADTIKAMDLLKKRNYQIGLQIMIGLPGDSPEKALVTAKKIAALQPDFVRIYPTVVLEHSFLAQMYKQGKYSPPSLTSSVSLAKNLFLYFKEKNIAVVRMGLQAAEDLDSGAAILAGPYHPAFGHLVYSEIFLDTARMMLEKHKSNCDCVTIKVHPRSISKMKGLKNQNIATLKRDYNIRSRTIRPDSSLSTDTLILD